MSEKLIFVYACVVFSVYSTEAETLHTPCSRATSADAQGDCSVGEVCTVADTFDASDGCSYNDFENTCFKCGCGNLDQCVIVWPVSRGGIRSPYPSYICNCDNGFTGDNCDETVRSSFGKSFVLALLINNFSSGVTASVYITSAELTNVNITIPSTGDFNNVAVNGFHQLVLNNALLPLNTEESNKGIRITADGPIAVYAINANSGTTGGNMVFPEQSLSNQYIIPSHPNNINGQVVIVGTEDNTVLNITYTSGTTTSTVIANLGTYYIHQNGLDGATISASANVAVIAGHTCANIPAGVSYCDYIAEQIPPLQSLKTTFVVAFMKPRVKYTVKVLAAEDGTSVSVADITGTLIETITLNKGQSLIKEFTSSNDISIISTKGVLVTQYGHSTQSDNAGFGDPSMTVIPAIDQYTNIYQFIVPAGYTHSKVNLFISNAHNISGILLNGNAVPTTGSVQVTVPGIGDFTVINIDVPDGFNRLTHLDTGVKFGAVQYGQKRNEEYAWTLGMIV